jgi:phage repressor protein C with HTH and peptisase S24 domain
MKISEFLKTSRKASKATQKEVADSLGVSQGVYSKWENGTLNPNAESLAKIESYYHIKLNIPRRKLTAADEKLLDIMRKIDEKRRKNVVNYAELQLSEHLAEVREPATIYQIRMYRRKDLYSANLSSQLASAGYGEAILDFDEKSKVFTADRLRRNDGAVRLRGDSMEDKFSSGTIVSFVNTGFDRDGDFYILADENQQLYCKQVFKEKEGFRCHSLNEKYDDFYLTSEPAGIVGPVVDVIDEVTEDQIID